MDCWQQPLFSLGTIHKTNREGKATVKKAILDFIKKELTTVANTIDEILSGTTYLFLIAGFMVVTVGLMIGKLTPEQWLQCFMAIAALWTGRGLGIHFSKDSDSNKAKEGGTSEPADN